MMSVTENYNYNVAMHSQFTAMDPSNQWNLGHCKLHSVHLRLCI